MTTKPVARPRGRSKSSDRILAAGLASATCIGLVGVIGVRAAQSAEPDTQPVDFTESVSSVGYNPSDLDAYAAQLQTQAAQLDAYKKELKQTAKQLNREIAAYNDAVAAGQQVVVEQWTDPGTSNSGGSSNWQPAQQPQPQPAQQPQSNSQSS